MGRIGYFGGTFDPPHLGHLAIGRAVLASGLADQVAYAPAYVPPHKQERKLSPFADRLAMTEALIRGEPGLWCCDLENRLRLFPSYTIEMLAAFRREHPADEVALVIGGDSLVQLPTWHRARELVAEYRVITFPRREWRPDWRELARFFGEEGAGRLRQGVLAVPFQEISSTSIRKKVEKGEKLDHIISEGVKTYLEEHGLYRGTEAEERKNQR